MEDIKLSVIIPCYNLGLYLEEAVESVISFVVVGAIELILVNDGSTDKNTLRVIKTIKTKYPDIRVIHQDNQGLAKARNNGIAIAKGTYIIPLDADNKLRSVFISESIAILDTYTEVQVVYGNAEYFGTKSGLMGVLPFDVEELVLNNYIDACACFRKTAWEAVGGYDEQMPIMGFEDWDMWLRMMVKGFQFRYVDCVFFDYRAREGSMLSNAWEHRTMLLDYMFSKPSLQHLSYYRRCVLENRQLKEEPSFKYLIGVLVKKLKRRLGF